MDPKTRAIAFGVIALVVLAAIIGSIIYLGKTSQRSVATRNNSLSNLPVVTAQPSPGATSSTNSSGYKTYAGNGFAVRYPASWGLLTCSNTENFEFDPTNSQDITGVVCDTAVKPLTVMVGNSLGCTDGQTETIGNYQVNKSSGILRGGGTQTRWCVTVGGKILNITNRVSNQGNQATSPTDYSAQIEEMIKTISATPTAS